MTSVQIHKRTPYLCPYPLALARILFHDAERRARDGRTIPPTIRHFTWEARV